MIDNPLCSKARVIEECYYCKLIHKHVEAAGLWHCPNPLCTGPGASYFRGTLSSYREIGDRHTVDPVEIVFKGMAAAYDTKDKLILKAALRTFKEKWKVEFENALDSMDLSIGETNSRTSK